jgi:hypothetical protein
MDSIANFRERVEALEQRMQSWHQHIHTAARQRRGWRLSWCVIAVMALGLDLAHPDYSQAKSFRCGAGDVACLIHAIHAANRQASRIRFA